MVFENLTGEAERSFIMNAGASFKRCAPLRVEVPAKKIPSFPLGVTDHPSLQDFGSDHVATSSSSAEKPANRQAVFAQSPISPTNALPLL